MPRVLHWDFDHMVRGKFLDWDERVPQDYHANRITTNLLRESATTGLAGEDPTVDPAHVPRHLRMTTRTAHSRRVGIADVFTTVNGVTVVSRRLAELIEAMDPGRHQLFELATVTNAGGGPLEEVEANGPYFILNVRPVQEALDRERLGYGPMDRGFPDYYGLNPTSNVVLRAERLDPEIDMWRERFVDGSHIFVSDRLAAAIDEHGIAFFTPVPATIEMMSG